MTPSTASDNQVSNKPDVERLREILREIAADMELDAARFDGQPFTGRTVAEYCGNQGAAIAALANIVATLLPK